MRTHPYIAIASYHVVDGKKTSETLAPLLEGVGYAVLTEFPQHQTTYGLSR